MVKKIAIVGGGIVGLAAALKVSQRYPQAMLHLFEKEATVGEHQSGNNSGVLHCGLYYKPGSLKAKLAVEGIREMIQFCVENDIPHEVCGKLVVATNPIEVSRLDDLEPRGRQNGLKGIQRLCGGEIQDHEPYAVGLAALKVPEEGIVDYGKVCSTLKNMLEEVGHSIHIGTRILSGRLTGSKFQLSSYEDEWEFDYVVNCAGLHSDRVCRQLGGQPSVKIIPFRGEYYKLRENSQRLVNNLIYPVPDPAFPFLGVHFSRLIRGGVEAGPNAVLAFSREGYRKRDVKLADLAEVAAFPGIWKFAAKYRRMCLGELMQSFSRKLFCRNLQKLIPSINESDLEPGGAGVRAQAMSPYGSLVEDFAFVEGEKILHVLNAPSPAATASLAIGGEIASRINLN
ncbi:MAG: L-2-hydroxyglutarate oxidase [Verrucomicrobiales bacterium]